MVLKKKPTKKVAVVKGRETSREVEMEVENVNVQDGVNPRSKLGTQAQVGKAVIGLSLGATLNMGDYQSARIDVFIQRTVEDDEDIIRDEMERISETLHDELARQSALLSDDE